MRIDPNPPGTALSRYISALVKGGGSLTSALGAAEAHRDSPSVALTVKAAIDAMSSGAASAGALAAYGIGNEFVSLLNPLTAIGRARPRMRRLPFQVRTPRELAAVGGGWLGLGAAIPVTRADFDGLTLERYEAAVIVMLTKELAMTTGTAGEAAVRAVVLSGVAAFLDAQFLNPSIALSAGENPASITFGAPSVASSGVTASALLADLAAVAGLVTTDFVSPVWIMRPSTVKKLAVMETTAGTRAFPDLNLQTGGTIFGIPVLLSRNVPLASGSPTANLIILADLDAIAFADDDDVDLALSQQTSLQAVDNPSLPATQVSLFQANSVAIRAVRTVSWQRVHDGAVAYLDDLAL